MATIRATWPEGPGRELALEKLQRELVLLSEACGHKSHPDDWFEDPGVGYATDAYWRRQKAKYLCYYECPVRIQCLNEGFKEENMSFGTYGGLFVEERQEVQRAALERKSRRVDREETPE